MVDATDRRCLTCGTASPTDTLKFCTKCGEPLPSVSRSDAVKTETRADPTVSELRERLQLAEQRARAEAEAQRFESETRIADLESKLVAERHLAETLARRAPELAEATAAGEVNASPDDLHETAATPTLSQKASVLNGRKRLLVGALFLSACAIAASIWALDLGRPGNSTAIPSMASSASQTAQASSPTEVRYMELICNSGIEIRYRVEAYENRSAAREANCPEISALAGNVPAGEPNLGFPTSIATVTQRDGRLALEGQIIAPWGTNVRDFLFLNQRQTMHLDLTIRIEDFVNYPHVDPPYIDLYGACYWQEQNCEVNSNERDLTVLYVEDPQGLIVSCCADDYAFNRLRDQWHLKGWFWVNGCAGPYQGVFECSIDAVEPA